MKTELYPLKFTPIVKSKVWGGEKLKTVLKKNTTFQNTGESWELSAVEKSISVVANGALAGENLLDLVAHYGRDLVGDKVADRYGDAFPLLFKFIDAKENLSIQLHPDDNLAKKRHNSLGKTEMWYVMQADENAGIYVGFTEGVTRDDYLTHLEKGDLEKLMNFERVRPGDVFFIKPGLVHSIGKGVLLAEIQQSSDITYRVFDWNRLGQDGQPRELHTQLALDAIDFVSDEAKINYTDTVNTPQVLVRNHYFTTRKIKLKGSLSRHYKNADSFRVVMCVEGRLEIHSPEGELRLTKGETALIPACLQEINLTSTLAELLEITI